MGVGPLTAAGVEEARRLAAGALAIERGGTPGDVRDSGVPTGELFAAVRRHRLASLLGPVAEQLGCPADEIAVLRDAQRRDELAAMAVVSHVHRVHGVLERAGLRAIFFKGPALAAQTTGRATARGAGDVDVWVSPGDLTAAHRALEADGLVPHPWYPTPGDSWGWRWMVRTYYELSLRSGALHVDLHWHLDQNRTGLPDFDTAWGRRQGVDLLGREVPTLSALDALDHSCRHAEKDRYAWLRSLVDIQRLRTQVPSASAVERRLTRRGLEVAATCLGSGASGAEPAGTSRRSHAQEWPRKHPIGVGALAALARHSRQAATARDLGRNLGLMVLPPRACGGVEADAWHRAVPMAARQRVARAGRSPSAEDDVVEAAWT